MRDRAAAITLKQKIENSENVNYSINFEDVPEICWEHVYNDAVYQGDAQRRESFEDARQYQVLRCIDDVVEANGHGTGNRQGND